MRFFTTVLLTLSLAFTALPSAAFAYNYEQSIRSTIVDKLAARTIVVRTNKTRHTDETYYQVHVKRGCADRLKEGKTVDLVTHGGLDGNRDFIKISPYIRCAIDQGNEVNERLYVKKVYNSQEAAVVTDETGQDHYISVNTACHAIFAYRQKILYAFTGGFPVETGSVIFLPERGNKCVIQHASKIEDSEKKSSYDKKDVMRPNQVPQFNAIPNHDSAFLYWKAARDNVEVSHYVISYNYYPIKTLYYSFEEMPNKVEADGTNVLITELDKDRDYYFYIAAVDTSGNVSNRWSESHVRVKSSIPKNRSTLDYGINAREDGSPSKPVDVMWY